MRSSWSPKAATERTKAGPPGTHHRDPGSALRGSPVRFSSHSFSGLVRPTGIEALHPASSSTDPRHPPQFRFASALNCLYYSSCTNHPIYNSTNSEEYPVTKRTVLLTFGALVALTQSSYGQYCCGPAVGGGARFYGPPAMFYGYPGHVFAPHQFLVPNQFLVPTNVGPGVTDGTTVAPTTLVFVQGTTTNGARAQAAGRSAEAEADLARAIRELTGSIDRLRESKTGGGAPNTSVAPPTQLNRPQATPTPQRPVSGTEMGRSADLDRMLAEFERKPAGPRITGAATNGDQTVAAARK